MIIVPQTVSRSDGQTIGHLASTCLTIEIRTFPKPGLVSPIDTGAHDDMDAAMMERSAEALLPFFAELTDAGAAGASMDRLRAIGIAAEAAMMAVTGGVNTHRGAIFGMGLLCAAAGFRHRYAMKAPLGAIVAKRWGDEILSGPVPLRSHGTMVKRRHAVGGAQAEAASGFASLYQVALPALKEGRRLLPEDPEAALVHALIVLISDVADTNLLYRGGAEGLAFAQGEARSFLDAGSIANSNWRIAAIGMHRAFSARRLSPGGCADLLAMALFVEALGG